MKNDVYKKYLKKITKTIFWIVVIVLSVNILFHKVPETNFMEETVQSLDQSQETITKFSGTTIAASVAMSALPDDFASPLAGTISDLNVYLIFMLIVIFAEKLIVLEGTKIALACIIPVACILYIVYVWSKKDVCKQFARKLVILGTAVILVIPISTHFTEYVCADYLAYVDETIAATQDGADAINEALEEEDDANFFDKVSGAFEGVIQGAKDLLTYFEGIVKKCINSIAIMIVTSFVLPLLILMLFKWLLKELFSLNIPAPDAQLDLLVKKVEDLSKKNKLHAADGEDKNGLYLPEKNSRKK